MQNIERNGYTREEILDVLHAKKTNRKIGFKYNLLDKYNRKIKELDSVIDGEVAFSAFSQIKRTAKFNIQERYVEEHIARVEDELFHTYTMADSWDRGTKTNVVNSGNSLKLNVPSSNFAPSQDFEDFTSGAMPSGYNQVKHSGVTVSASGASTIAMTGTKSAYQNITGVTTAGAVGWETNAASGNRYITAGQVAHLSFFFHTNSTHAEWRNPDYCYIMMKDGQGNIPIPSNQRTITELGNGWGRYEGWVTIPRSSNAGFLIAWYLPAGTPASGLRIDNVYFNHSLPAIYEGEWVSPIRTVSKEKGLYTSSMLDIDLGTVGEGGSVTVQSRYSLNEGATWSNWATSSDLAPIAGMLAGDSIESLNIQYKIIFKRNNFNTDVFVSRLISNIMFTHEVVVPRTTEINYLSDRIQPFVTFQMPDGGTVEFPLGIFILSTPTKKDVNGDIYREIEAYDGLIILDEDKFTSRYTVAAGTKYTDAVINILVSAGIENYSIDTSKTDTILIPMEFAIGTSKLEAVNTILQAINYTPIWVDAYGSFTAYPYEAPSDRGTDYVYKDDEYSVIVNGAEEEMDIYSIANSWVVVQSNPETTPIKASYTNNSADSPTSVTNRGRTIVDFREVDNISNQTTMNNYVRRIAFEASQVYGKVRFQTAIMPFHEYYDVIQFEYSNLDVSAKYAETSWKIPLKVGSLMEHEARRVVSI